MLIALLFLFNSLYASHENWDQDLTKAVKISDWENCLKLTEQSHWHRKITPAMQSVLQVRIVNILKNEKKFEKKVFWHFIDKYLDKLPDFNQGRENNLKKNILLAICQRSAYDFDALTCLEKRMNSKLLSLHNYFDLALHNILHQQRLKLYDVPCRQIYLNRLPDMTAVVQEINKHDDLKGLVIQSLLCKDYQRCIKQIMNIADDDDQKNRLVQLYEKNYLFKGIINNSMDSLLGNIILYLIEENIHRDQLTKKNALKLFNLLHEISKQFKKIPLTLDDLGARVKIEHSLQKNYIDLLTKSSICNDQFIDEIAQANDDKITLWAEILRSGLICIALNKQPCYEKIKPDDMLNPYAVMISTMFNKKLNITFSRVDNFQLNDDFEPHTFLSALSLISDDQRKEIQDKISVEKFDQALSHWKNTHAKPVMNIEQQESLWRAWWYELKHDYQNAYREISKINDPRSLILKSYAKKLEVLFYLSNNNVLKEQEIVALCLETSQLYQKVISEYKKSVGIDRFWLVKSIDDLDDTWINLKQYQKKLSEKSYHYLDIIHLDLTMNMHVELSNIVKYIHSPDMLNKFYLNQLIKTMYTYFCVLNIYTQKYPLADIKTNWQNIEHVWKLLEENMHYNTERFKSDILNTFIHIIWQYIHSDCRRGFLNIPYVEREKLLIKGLTYLDQYPHKNDDWYLLNKALILYKMAELSTIKIEKIKNVNVAFDYAYQVTTILNPQYYLLFIEYQLLIGLELQNQELLENSIKLIEKIKPFIKDETFKTKLQQIISKWDKNPLTNKYQQLIESLL